MAVRLVVQKQEEFFGGLPDFVAPDSEGVEFYNDGGTQVLFNYAGFGSPTYTVVAQRAFFGTGFAIDYPEPDSNENGDIPNAALSNSSFFLPSRFNRADGTLVMTFSDFANLTVAAIKVQTAGVGGLD